MLDCIGQELNIGDNVIYADGRYADLISGKVIGFTPKKCRIKGKRFGFGYKGEHVTLKEQNQIVKIGKTSSNNEFDVKQVTEEIIDWIRHYFETNASPNTKAVIGISGGKDSSIVAALCTIALGADRVLGVLMPQGEQSDIDMSIELCSHLGIDSITVNIGDTVKSLYNALDNGENPALPFNSIVTNNTPARIRMATLYAVSASVGGRVANTCNLSEDWVGYSTKFGDSAGDFSPLANLTVAEVKAVAYEIGLASKFIEKTPIDGLCGKSDEDNLGFTYAVLDKYIRTGICDDEKIKARIDWLHKINQHKLNPMPTFSR